MRRMLLVGLVLACWAGAVLLVPLTGGVAAPSPVDPEAPADAHREEVVRPTGGESGVWPWLAPDPRFDRHAWLDVVVLADGERVVRALDAHGGEVEGAAGTTNRSANDDATRRDWEPTVGSARYAYVERRPSDGAWVRETVHLQDGHYYGRRVHLRCYASPATREEWLAIEAHVEHFDWFALRHEVEDVGSAPASVRRDLATAPRIDPGALERRERDGDEAASGLPTVVALVLDVPSTLGALLALVVPLASAVAVALVGDSGAGSGSQRVRETGGRASTDARRRRVDGLYREIAPVAGLVALVLGTVLGVRLAGVLLELYVPVLSAYQIAALGYPVLAVGLPLGARSAARGVEGPVEAGVAASLAAASAFALDHVAVGVEIVPTSVVLHRIGLAAAIGLLAAGAADSSRAAAGEAAVGRLAARDVDLSSLAGGLLWLGLLVVALAGAV